MVLLHNIACLIQQVVSRNVFSFGNELINFFCFFILCKNALTIRGAIIYKSRKMLKRAADSPWDTEFILVCSIVYYTFCHIWSFCCWTFAYCPQYTNYVS